MQLLAEKGKEQPAPVAAAVAAPAEPPRAAPQLPLAEASQQAHGVVAAAAQLDPSTAWKLEKMEAQVSVCLCFACFALSLKILNPEVLVSSG